MVCYDRNDYVGNVDTCRNGSLQIEFIDREFKLLVFFFAKLSWIVFDISVGIELMPELSH